MKASPSPLACGRASLASQTACVPVAAARRARWARWLWLVQLCSRPGALTAPLPALQAPRPVRKYSSSGSPGASEKPLWPGSALWGMLLFSATGKQVTAAQRSHGGLPALQAPPLHPVCCRYRSTGASEEALWTDAALRAESQKRTRCVTRSAHLAVCLPSRHRLCTESTLDAALPVRVRKHCGLARRLRAGRSVSAGVLACPTFSAHTAA